jgi:hypothetical protein
LMDTGMLPVTDYTGRVSITPAGGHACHIKFECEYSPVDAQHDDWPETYRAYETQLIACMAEMLR